MAEGVARYTQAHNTPFARHPILANFGYLAEKDAAEEVLSGTSTMPAEVDELTIKFLAKLK